MANLIVRSVAYALLVPLVAACSQNLDRPTVDLPETIPSELTGTSWQLVKIMSMDDRVYEALDGSYTLEFGTDGTVAMQADCNRGRGSWTSAQSGQLRFGRVAATRAMCAPGSLSERYLAQFEWVRSYVLKDHHLFLATLADGSIIEFAPASPDAAGGTRIRDTSNSRPSL